VSDVVEVGAFLTVPEVARRLKISRTAAYQLARRWLDGHVTDGIPAVRIGRSIRVPAAAFERWARGLPFLP
jgi:excisionase family DNA binding protein